MPVGGLPVLLRSQASSWAQRAIAFAFWVVLPALCVSVLIVGSDHLARRLNNIPPGTRGSYLVTSHSCSEEVCITGGTFTSADGQLVETDLLGVYSWKNGETHAVVYNSDSVDVIPLPAHWDPTATYVGMTGALGFIGLWLWCLIGSTRRQLRARAMPDPESDEMAGAQTG